MSRLELFCVDENNTIKDAIVAIQANHSRCIIVLNAKKKVVGVFSEGDVLKVILADTDIHAPLSRIIKPSFHYLNDKDMLKAYELVKKYSITLIPVVDKDFNLEDIITIFDIMDHLVFTNRRNK